MANKYLKGIVKKKGDFRTYTETTDETDKLVFTREGSDSQKGHLFFNGQEYGNDPIYEYTWDQPVVTDSTKKYAKIFTVPQYASIVMSFSIEQGTNRGTTDFLVVDDTYLKNLKTGTAAGSQFYTLQIASFFKKISTYSTDIYFPTFLDNGHFYNTTKIHFKLLYSNVDASQITFASSANPVYMDSSISGSVNDIVGVAKSAKIDTAVSTTFQYQVTTAGTATLDMKTYKDFIGNVDLMTSDTKNVQLTFSGTSTTNYNTDSIYRFEFNKKINSLYFINHGSTIASYTSDIYAGDVISLTPNVGTDSTVTWSIDVKHNSIYPLNDSLTIIKDDTGNFGLKVTDDYYQTTTSSTLNTTTKNVVGAINEVLAEKQDKLTFDTTPTLGSTNPVTSDGIKKALTGMSITMDSIPTQNSNNAVSSSGLFNTFSAMSAYNATYYPQIHTISGIVATAKYKVGEITFTKDNGYNGDCFMIAMSKRQYDDYGDAGCSAILEGKLELDSTFTEKAKKIGWFVRRGFAQDWMVVLDKSNDTKKTPITYTLYATLNSGDVLSYRVLTSRLIDNSGSDTGWKWYDTPVSGNMAYGVTTSDIGVVGSLATGRKLTLTGDVTGSFSNFDGSSDLTATTTLNTALTAGFVAKTGSTMTGNLTNSTTWTANRVAVVNDSNTLSTATITTTELGYLSGTSANVQVQLNRRISAVSSYNIDGIGNTSAVETNVTKLKLVGAYTSASTTSFGEIFNDYTNNKANGSYSHSEGSSTMASGIASHAEGSLSKSMGACSHSEGMGSISTGNYSHTEGYHSSAIGIASHSEGYSSITTGYYAHAEGHSSSAVGDTSHAEGYSISIGSKSHAEGNSSANGESSHSEGSSTMASGIASHAEGSLSKSMGACSHSEGMGSISTGNYSHTEGYSSSANGIASHSEGMVSISTGDYAHAEGYSSSAVGSTSHAEGHSISIGLKSHAEGNSSANGESSHSEGSSTMASGIASHAEGSLSKSMGEYSHAEGLITLATGNYSHTEGYSSSANGIASHAEGDSSITTGYYAHAEGRSSSAVGETSHAEGHITIAAADSSHSEGDNTQAIGYCSHSEGNKTSAIGIDSHAEGYMTSAIGIVSHAEGYVSSANGYSSHSEGHITIASGDSSHAEGNSTQANGEDSHAEGQGSQSNGLASHAEGSSIANGSIAHAEGTVTSAIGNSSHSEGTYTIASGDNQHVQGKYNIANMTSAFILGNGTNDARSNAMTVDWSGNTEMAGYCISHSTLEITTANSSTYFVTGASYNTLYIPYGYTTIFYSLATDSTINQILIVDNLTNKTNKMFNGYRISLAKSPGYGYLSAVSSVPVGKLSSNYYLQYKAGAEGASSTNQLLEAFEDFIYYNGTWYSKGY
jgi:hypothetical protein